VVTRIADQSDASYRRKDHGAIQTASEKAIAANVSMVANVDRIFSVNATAATVLCSDS
jgi:hypothetical protein